VAISNVKITIAGVEYLLTYNSTSGKWEKTINAPGATSWGQPNHVYACSVVATNTAGTSTTATVDTPSVGDALKLRVKETVKPIISITSPASGAFVTNNKQPIVFVITDEAGGSGLNISTLVVKLDGTEVSGVTTTAITNGYSCTYTPATALSDGSHTVSVNVSDNDGNAAVQKTVTYTIDTVPPTLNVVSPAENAILPSATVSVSGSTNDTTSSPVSITVSINGGTAQSVSVAGDGTFSKSVTCIEGANTITIVATDGAGKTSTITRHLTIDTSVPAITAVSISPNPVDTGATMLVAVTVV